MVQSAQEDGGKIRTPLPSAFSSGEVAFFLGGMVTLLCWSWSLMNVLRFDGRYEERGGVVEKRIRTDVGNYILVSCSRGDEW